MAKKINKIIIYTIIKTICFINKNKKNQKIILYETEVKWKKKNKKEVSIKEKKTRRGQIKFKKKRHSLLKGIKSFDVNFARKVVTSANKIMTKVINLPDTKKKIDVTNRINQMAEV